MRIFSKLFNKSGQNALEYVIIATLVMAGIIIGGPYVYRSWNAQMKAQEDSIQDSIREPFEQAPDLDLESICNCSDSEGKAPDTCGFGSCDAYSYRKAKKCLPVGCADAEEVCTPDPQCCTGWAQIGCYPASMPPGVSIPCAEGEMIYRKTCGDATNVQYECRPHENCVFECVGETDEGRPGHPDAKGWCSPAYKDYLMARTPVTYVSYDQCPDDPTLLNCLAECKEGYISTITGCECAEGPYVFAGWDANGGSKDCFGTIGWAKTWNECAAMGGGQLIMKDLKNDIDFMSPDGTYPCNKKLSSDASSFDKCKTLVATAVGKAIPTWGANTVSYLFAGYTVKGFQNGKNKIYNDHSMDYYAKASANAVVCFPPHCSPKTVCCKSTGDASGVCKKYFLGYPIAKCENRSAYRQICRNNYYVSGVSTASDKYGLASFSSPCCTFLDENNDVVGDTLLDISVPLPQDVRLLATHDSEEPNCQVVTGNMDNDCPLGYVSVVLDNYLVTPTSSSRLTDSRNVRNYCCKLSTNYQVDLSQMIVNTDKPYPYSASDNNDGGSKTVQECPRNYAVVGFRTVSQSSIDKTREALNIKCAPLIHN